MIVVDAPSWPWRGRRWAHLASDRDTGELHDFAARLGLRRTAFQGDHYDVDEELRIRALELGARPVDARDLVRRLRAAGLRRRGGQAALHWELVGELAVAGPTVDRSALARLLGPELVPDTLDEVVDRAAALVEGCEADVEGDAGAGWGEDGEDDGGKEDAGGLVLGVLRRPGEVAVVVSPRGARWPPRRELVVVGDLVRAVG